MKALIVQTVDSQPFVLSANKNEFCSLALDTTPR